MLPLDLVLISNIIKWIAKNMLDRMFISKVSSLENEENNKYYSRSFNDIYYTGTITKIRDDLAFIDGRYTFSTSQISRDVSVGNIVTFIRNSNKDGISWDLTVIDILDELGEEELDVSPLYNSKTHGVIIKRDLKIFTVSPGSLEFNLDDVTTTFIPEIGDWIEIHMEKNGAHHTMMIHPQGYRVITGVVTSFDDEIGIINDSVIFQRHHCQPGYYPRKGDYVVVSVIRCQNSVGQYRALHVTPVKRKDKDYIQFLPSTQNLITDIIFHPMELVCINVNEAKIINAEIFNNSTIEYKLIRLKAFSAECSIELLEPTNINITLMPKSSTPFKFKVSLKYLGFSTINFDYMFEDTIFHCCLNLLAVNKVNEFVMSQLSVSKSGTPISNNKGKGKSLTYDSKYKYSNKAPIPGRRFSPSIKFYPVQLGLYEIPDQMKKILNENERNQSLRNELEAFYPCLQAGIREDNYKIFMHCLLYLEEIAALEKVSKLELISGFEKKDDYLVLHIEEDSNLNMLQSGDKVFAKKPWETDGDVFEGIIWHVAPEELNVKFSQSFHCNYISRSEYLLTFKLGRTQVRLNHQAVDDVVHQLGSNWLFPNKISLLTPLIIEVFNDWEENGSRSCYREKKNTKWNRYGSGYGNDQKRYTINNVIPLDRKRVIRWYNVDLNDEQKWAIVNCLRAESRPFPYIIFGPPGTGKTVTLVEVCLQIYNMIPESKILLVAPSNSAADQLSLNLISSGFINNIDFVRLGGYRYMSSGNMPQGLAKFVALPEFRSEPINDDIPRINRNCLSEKRIIISTLGSIGILRSMGFPNGYFTHFIIDEAGQVTEPENLKIVGLMSKENQIILAGDPLQLGPVVISSLAKTYGLHRSFLHRLCDFKPYMFDKVGFPNSYGYNPKFITKLVKNYRSLPKLLDIVSFLFYRNELKPMVDSFSSREATIYSKVKELFPPNSQIPIMFHSLPGSEMIEDGTYSYYNNKEVVQICTYLTQLYRLGFKSYNIGIVTPYIAQVKKIFQFLNCLDHEIPKIGSVEEFQGQERDIILLSTVRSSLTLDPNIVQMSFIYNPQRINVAISRAKAVLIVVGNSTTLNGDEIWRNILQYTIDHKSYRE